MLRKAVEDNPGCDGIILGGHGLFTWGETQRECYLSSIKTIDQMGEFVQEHARRSGQPQFGGAIATTAADREALAGALLPYLRGAVSSNRRVIAHYDSSDDALAFANSKWAEELCGLGTSCPDHFLRTRISPLYVQWKPEDGPRRAQAEDRRAADHLPRGLRQVLQGARRHGVAGAARLESVGGRGPGHRAVRVRQGQARGAHHLGVLRQRHPRDGRRQRARGRRHQAGAGAAGAARRAGGGVQELPQLRRAAARGGVPHRVLGARGGQAAADAARARVQPQGRRRRRRRQRHRPRGRAAARQARRARRGRRSRTRPAPRRSPRKPAAHSSAGAGAWASRST